MNVGAGTITCNYDGKKKHPTIIEDEVFIGSNTALVAPIKIGRSALIGAGSTITKEVPPDTLAVYAGRNRSITRKDPTAQGVRILCAASSAISDRGRRKRSFWKGLRRLEYRGYDSAGIALYHEGKVVIRRSTGKLRELEKKTAEEHFSGKIGIGHTRWATHGRPSEANAHPHKAGGVVVVHNGIIENYLGLKAALTREGHTFKSETDTEILSHLIQSNLFKGLSFEEAVRQALLQVQGSYAVAVLYEGEKDKMIAARKESPLILGLGRGGVFRCLRHPGHPALHAQDDLPGRRGDGRPRGGFLPHFDPRGEKSGSGRPKISSGIRLRPKRADTNILCSRKSSSSPGPITDTIRGRISLEEGDVSLQESGLTPKALKDIRRVVIVACGTSSHAALVGKFMIEEIARMPVEVDLGSEFRYRDPLIGPQDLLLAISQSGETTDTLAAFREGKEKRSPNLGHLQRGGQQPGPAIGRSCFIPMPDRKSAWRQRRPLPARLSGFSCWPSHWGLRGKPSPPKGQKPLGKFDQNSPPDSKKSWNSMKPIAALAKKYMNARDFLYLGRGVNYPIALEGALKLKEISYIHAEGYPAGEMKHGPIALIDEELPVVVLAPKGKTYEKILSNIEEVRARGGKVIALANPGSEEIASKAKDVLWIPESHHLLMPILFNVPLQLLAYNIAVLKGTDVDQPRNLAKSVTVEYRRRGKEIIHEKEPSRSCGRTP